MLFRQNHVTCLTLILTITLIVYMQVATDTVAKHTNFCDPGFSYLHLCHHTVDGMMPGWMTDPTVIALAHSTYNQMN